jgi:hypothetical protein
MQEHWMPFLVPPANEETLLRVFSSRKHVLSQRPVTRDAFLTRRPQPPFFPKSTCCRISNPEPQVSNSSKPFAMILSRLRAPPHSLPSAACPASRHSTLLISLSLTFRRSTKKADYPTDASRCKARCHYRNVDCGVCARVVLRAFFQAVRGVGCPAWLCALSLAFHRRRFSER